MLINGSCNGTALPWVWRTDNVTFNNQWWNLTVRVTNTSGYTTQDQILVFVDNMPTEGCDLSYDIPDPELGSYQFPVSVNVTLRPNDILYWKIGFGLRSTVAGDYVISVGCYLDGTFQDVIRAAVRVNGTGLEIYYFENFITDLWMVHGITPGLHNVTIGVTQMLGPVPLICSNSALLYVKSIRQ